MLTSHVICIVVQFALPYPYAHILAIVMLYVMDIPAGVDKTYVFPPCLQLVPAARGARIVFVIAIVVTSTLRVTRHSDVPNVRTASRAETVTMT